MNEIVFDIETQNSFREVNNDTRKLKVSVAVCYDYATDSTNSFSENNLSGLFNLFEKASVIIGYNSNNFDLVVLNEYYVGNLFKLPSFDLLDEIKTLSGKRYPLDDVAKSTLGKGKSGHGLAAINLYREGKIEELIKYCTDDVRLTKELFDFGVKNDFIYLPTFSNKQKLTVHWQKASQSNGSNNSPNLTFGF
jgi:DEAD/DEAH box helicase domain-containing protein